MGVLCLKLLKLRCRVLKLRCRTKGQIMYKNVGVGGLPPATGCKAGMQLPPLILPVINGRSNSVLCMKLTQLYSCLSNLYSTALPIESLSQLAQLDSELDSVRTQPAPHNRI